MAVYHGLLERVGIRIVAHETHERHEMEKKLNREEREAARMSDGEFSNH
jgi:hypothetical protein